jgi:hypothetical protein
MPDWRTDDELAQKSVDLTKEFEELFKYEWHKRNDDPIVGRIWPEWAYFDHVEDAIPYDRLKQLKQDYGEFTTLNLDSLSHELDDAQDLCRGLSDSGPVFTGLADADPTKIGWSGDAARGFGGRKTEIEGTLREYREDASYLVTAVGSYMAVGIGIRKSFCDLADVTISACRKARGASGDRDATFYIAQAADTVSAIVDATKGGNPLTVSVNMIANTIKNGTPFALGGSDYKELMQGYEDSVNKLADSYDSSIREANALLSRRHVEMFGRKVLVYEDSAGLANVYSPDFSYEKFQSQSRPPSVFGSKVTKARKQGGSAGASFNASGEIARALDPEGT